jgi:hypothetical protein
MSATIEPDADGDGFGDETFDQCPQSAASSQPCPPHGRVGVGVSKPVVIAGETIAVSLSLRTQPQQLHSVLHVDLPPQLVATATPEGCSVLPGEVVCAMSGWPSVRPITVAAARPGTATITAALRTDGKAWASGAGQVTVLPAGRCAHVVPGGPTAQAPIAGTIAGDVITGTRRADFLLGGEGDDCLNGLGGADRIDGSTGADKLNGGDGGDRLAGGPGLDRLSGGPGVDVIQARDGARELVRCGPGRDLARLDRRDRAIGCERMRRP